jgi:hypothetical protein
MSVMETTASNVSLAGKMYCFVFENSPSCLSFVAGGENSIWNHLFVVGSLSFRFFCLAGTK